jgi:hypothetical protein
MQKTRFVIKYPFMGIDVINCDLFIWTCLRVSFDVRLSILCYK